MGSQKWVDPGIQVCEKRCNQYCCQTTESTLHTQDIRFLHDVKRVNFTKHPSLVMSTIDFYFSVVISRGGVEEGLVGKEREEVMKKRDYADVLDRCMKLISSMADGLLPDKSH